MKNNLTLDNQILMEISDDLKQEMSPIFYEIHQKIQSENFEELSKWYMRNKLTKTKIINEIANKIVEKITDCLPKTFAQFVIDNINIDYENEKPGVTFDVNYELEPLKFYVEFLVRINRQYITSGRVRFEINTNGTFKELKFQHDKKDGKKSFCLGQLEANMRISLVGLPFVESVEPLELVNKQFVADLSKYFIR